MDGVLIIDKPAGWTSHDVVARARRLLREKRVGHTGTLDPFATGVLVLLVGRATRLAQFLAGAEKEYEATVRFGYKTDTGDLTGAPLSPVEPAAARLSAVEEDEFERALGETRASVTPEMEREYEQIQDKLKQDAMSATSGGIGFIAPGMLTPRGPKG